jgi:RsiW-degrading membrane proteinase PrsW (M82 family)
MTIFYILIALFIAWIWVDYYRLIDIFDRNHWGYVIAVFFMGAASTLLVGPANELFITPFGFELNGHFINDFLYCTFGIGMVEEVSKIVPFLIVHKFLRSHLREPIDYITFVAISALGFSAAENVQYFTSYGSHLIDSRSILCSVGHMFFTSIFAYGFILLTFHPKYKNPFLLVLTLLLASLSHGLYDFFLMYEGIPFGYLITIVYFFFCISIFATILNNALNNSSFFTYKKAIDIDRITKRILMYYGIVFLIQFILISYEYSFGKALFGLVKSLIMPGLIVAVCAARLSRFRLIEGRWNPVKLELPFVIFGKSDITYNGFTPFNLRIKGASFNEIYLSKHYQEYVQLIPVSSRNSFVQVPRWAYLEKKIHLKNDDSYYITRLYHDGKEGDYDTVLLKPKASGITRTKNNNPLVGLMDMTYAIDRNGKQKKKYRFREWVYLKT